MRTIDRNTPAELVCRPPSGPAPPGNWRPPVVIAETQGIAEQGRRDLLQGARIHFLMGPERIEAGWWDSDGIRRDYYVGVDDIAGRVWIYHDLTTRQKWYLHGLLG